MELKRGPIANPLCPICRKEAEAGTIEPSEIQLRVQPGHPCRSHRNAKQNEYQKAYTKKNRMREKYLKLAYQATAWVKAVQIELAWHHLMDEFTDVEDALMTLDGKVPPLPKAHEIAIASIRRAFGGRSPRDLLEKEITEASRE